MTTVLQLTVVFMEIARAHKPTQRHKTTTFLHLSILFFREGLVKHNPNTIRKVIAPFILTFKNGVKGIEEKLKNMVQNLGKLDDMPVYKDSLHIAGK